jgi:hypothetical protein
VTEIREEIREGNPADCSAPDAQAESAQRARSITPPASVALDALTQGGRAARQTMASALAAFDKPGSLFGARPATFQEARAWHHQCAGHYEAALLRWPRLVWGYVHLLVVMPALRAAEWVTGSPARLFVTLAVTAVIWFGS